MCKLLLSINPEYVEKIFAGVKEYEFRKSRCKRPIDGIIFYCTSPVKRVVGEASVKRVLVDDPSRMWQKVKNTAGITHDFYDQYYSGRKNAVAYQLVDIKRYDVPKQLEEFGIYHAPQSYIYLAEY